MILVDSSVWIEHLRASDSRLLHLLDELQVLVHPLVIGELACGWIAKRQQVLSALADLPRAREASHREALTLIERHGLAGQGLGYIDVHLLASALITGARLWTRDRSLASAARQMGVGQ